MKITEKFMGFQILLLQFREALYMYVISKLSLNKELLYNV